MVLYFAKLKGRKAIKCCLIRKKNDLHDGAAGDKTLLFESELYLVSGTVKVSIFDYLILLL